MEVACKARLGGAGLLGDVRGDPRGDVRGDVRCRRGFDEEIPGLFLADRRESFTLGRKGVARGDWPWKEVGAGEFGWWPKY